MLKRVLRMIGFALVALGLYLLVTTPSALTGEVWKATHFKSLQLIQPALERYIAVWLWDPVLLNILITPAFITFIVLSLPFLYFGLKKEKNNVQSL